MLMTPSPVPIPLLHKKKVSFIHLFEIVYFMLLEQKENCLPMDLWKNVRGRPTNP